MTISDVYEDHDALGLAALVARGETSPEELLDAALERAEALNPALNCLTHLRPETARANIAAGLPEGPFRGVPFLLKDLGVEAVGFPGHNGSRLSADTEYKADCNLFIRMRDTGLVTFGRTTSPEGGVGAVTEAVVYGGPTRNPWDLNRTPGGSSGGAAAAVAAGIVPMAQGSDGGGSIRIPASSSGVFGMKLTRALMPEGPFCGEGWGGMAIDGFLTRSVRDMAAILDEVTGPDLGAPYYPPQLKGTFRAAMARPPRRLRIGLCDTSFTGAAVHPECRQAVLDAAKLLEDLGHVVVPFVPKADHMGMMAAWTTIVGCGTALTIRQKLQKLGRDLRDGDVEPVARGAIAFAASKSGADYLESLETIHDYGREMAHAFDTVDVILSPTLAEPPAEIGRFAHKSEDFSDYRNGPEGVFPYSPYTACFNASGQPAVSLPLHWTPEGLPVGVHLAMPFGEDTELLALSAEIEAAKPWFHLRPPAANRFRPTGG